MSVGQSWCTLFHCLFHSHINGPKVLLFIRSCLNWFLYFLLFLFCGVCNQRLYKKRQQLTHDSTPATDRKNNLVWTHLSCKGKAKMQEWLYVRLLWLLRTSRWKLKQALACMMKTSAAPPVFLATGKQKLQHLQLQESKAIAVWVHTVTSQRWNNTKMKTWVRKHTVLSFSTCRVVFLQSHLHKL